MTEKLLLAGVLAAPILGAWSYCRAMRAWDRLVAEGEQRRQAARRIEAEHRERVERACAAWEKEEARWRAAMAEAEAEEVRAFMQALDLEAAFAAPCAPNPRLRYCSGRWYQHDREQRRREAR